MDGRRARSVSRVKPHRETRRRKPKRSSVRTTKAPPARRILSPSDTLLVLRFLGTRGEIELRTERHRRHSVLMVSAGGNQVLVDCGADWRDELERLRPRAIVVTHAHPDHVGGLRRGAPCPVYATAATWETIGRYPLPARETVRPREPFEIGGIRFEAFALEHSLVAPAVAYRITRGGRSLLYAPDVLSISERAAALGGVTLYVGDGASPTRPIVRRRGRTRIGHASIKQQLDWCAAASVSRAAFTHCGSQILRDEEGAGERVRALGAERGVRAELAYDGLRLVLR